MIHQKILEELDKNIVSTFQETRGGVVSFLNTVVENLHVATIKPGAVRANHKYIHDEVICIMGGESLCCGISGGHRKRQPDTDSGGGDF